MTERRQKFDRMKNSRTAKRNAQHQTALCLLLPIRPEESRKVIIQQKRSESEIAELKGLNAALRNESTALQNENDK